MGVVCYTAISNWGRPLQAKISGKRLHRGESVDIPFAMTSVGHREFARWETEEMFLILRERRWVRREC